MHNMCVFFKTRSNAVRIGLFLSCGIIKYHIRWVFFYLITNIPTRYTPNALIRAQEFPPLSVLANDVRVCDIWFHNESQLLMEPMPALLKHAINFLSLLYDYLEEKNVPKIWNARARNKYLFAHKTKLEIFHTAKLSECHYTPLSTSQPFNHHEIRCCICCRLGQSTDSTCLLFWWGEEEQISSL